MLTRSDAMIAATALFHGLPLVTAHSGDFDGIANLEVITRWGRSPGNT